MSIRSIAGNPWLWALLVTLVMGIVIHSSDQDLYMTVNGQLVLKHRLSERERWCATLIKTAGIGVLAFVLAAMVEYVARRRRAG